MYLKIWFLLMVQWDLQQPETIVLPMLHQVAFNNSLDQRVLSFDRCTGLDSRFNSTAQGWMKKIQIWYFIILSINDEKESDEANHSMITYCVWNENVPRNTQYCNMTDKIKTIFSNSWIFGGLICCYCNNGISCICQFNKKGYSSGKVISSDK